MNLKLAFNYYAAFEATAKIDSSRVIIASGKADGKWLLGL